MSVIARRASQLTLAVLVGCSPTPTHSTVRTTDSGNSRRLELVIVAAPAPLYSSHLPTYLETFDYATADRRGLEVIDVAVEPSGAESSSIRLTLDPQSAVQLNRWVPVRGFCELGLLVDRRLVSIIPVRMPIDDALYVYQYSLHASDTIEGLTARIKDASHLDLDPAYSPAADSSSWIELERVACSQRCPQYTLRVHGDGAVLYIGSAGVSRVGRRDGVMSALAVHRLFRRFAAANLFELSDGSLGSEEPRMPFSLTLTIGNRTRRCTAITDARSTASDRERDVGELLNLLANTIDTESESRHWVGRSDRLPWPIVERAPEYEFKNAANFELRFKRWGAFDSPIYELAIGRDGSVRYRGIDGVAIHGAATTVIAPEMVEALVDRLQSMGFWQLDERYDSMVMDEPATVTTLTIDGRSKTVTNRWGEGLREERPNIATHRALDAIALAIDAAVDAEQWVRR